MIKHVLWLQRFWFHSGEHILSQQKVIAALICWFNSKEHIRHYPWIIVAPEVLIPFQRKHLARQSKQYPFFFYYFFVAAPIGRFVPLTQNDAARSVHASAARLHRVNAHSHPLACYIQAWIVTVGDISMYVVPPTHCRCHCHNHPNCWCAHRTHRTDARHAGFLVWLWWSCGSG